jgi:hypothetical protein
MNKKNWQTILSYFFVGLIFLLLGIFIQGYLVTKSIISYKHEFDIPATLISLLSMAITVSAAFWVAKVLEKEKEEKRTEKNLIIAKVQELSSKVDFFGEKIISGTIPFIEVTSWLKRMSMNSKMIKDVVALSDMDSCQFIEAQINQDIQLLKNSLTTTPVTGSSVSPLINVANDTITITAHGMIQLEGQIESLSNNILKYQIEINKA